MNTGKNLTETQLNSLVNSYLIECSEMIFDNAIELETLTNAIFLEHRLIHPKTLTPKELPYSIT